MRQNIILLVVGLLAAVASVAGTVIGGRGGITLSPSVPPPTAGGLVYGDGSKITTTAAGTTGQALLSAGASAPTWGAVPPVAAWHTSYAVNPVPLALDVTPVPESTNFEGAYRSLTAGTFRTIACTIFSTGAGGSTGVVMSIYNATDTAQLCSCTLGACNAAGPLTCDCNTAFLASKTYVGRLTSGTDCVVNPAGISCNVEITR